MAYKLSDGTPEDYGLPTVSERQMRALILRGSSLSELVAELMRRGYGIARAKPPGVLRAHGRIDDYADPPGWRQAPDACYRRSRLWRERDGD